MLMPDTVTVATAVSTVLGVREESEATVVTREGIEVKVAYNRDYIDEIEAVKTHTG